MVKLEVVDTERFNEEINLGEVNLLLSTLMSPACVSMKRLASPQQVAGNGLEIAGTYTLTKGAGSSRYM